MALDYVAGGGGSTGCVARCFGTATSQIATCLPPETGSCNGTDDGTGAACRLDAQGTACAVVGGDCVYSDPDPTCGTSQAWTGWNPSLPGLQSQACPANCTFTSAFQPRCGGNAAAAYSRWQPPVLLSDWLHGFNGSQATCPEGCSFSPGRQAAPPPPPPRLPSGCRWDPRASCSGNGQAQAGVCYGMPYRNITLNHMGVLHNCSGDSVTTYPLCNCDEYYGQALRLEFTVEFPRIATTSPARPSIEDFNAEHLSYFDGSDSPGIVWQGIYDADGELVAVQNDNTISNTSIPTGVWNVTVSPTLRSASDPISDA